MVSDIQFNQAGKLSYKIITQDQEIIRKIDAPQNYSLEVEQLGRCIQEGESPFVTEEFTLTNAGIMDKVLAAIGYR